MDCAGNSTLSVKLSIFVYAADLGNLLFNDLMKFGSTNSDLSMMQ